jgi:squalene synthase HpnC
MATASVLDDLGTYGPDGGAKPPSQAEARDYCRRLARTHYENFAVASKLLPHGLRQHFYHVYAYCRSADDLADETGDREQSLKLLRWWEQELEACYAGRPRHPVFVALSETIAEYAIPIEPFRDLLTAFRQDQTTTWYASFDELLGYCRNSANPVGRLVLHLGRCCDERHVELSDAIFTGLQLANFWQDVHRDRRKGRIYLPLDEMARYGVSEADLDAPTTSTQLKRLLHQEVARAEEFLCRGLPLAEMMPRGLGGDIWLFAQGGLKILRKIRAIDYDVLARRPQVSKFDQLRLLAGCVWRNWRGGAR